MGHRTYSTSDLSRKSGDIIADALHSPVTITQRNKPRLIILNIEDYQRLKAKADPRKIGTIDSMPDDLLLEIERAVESYAEGGQTDDG